MIVRKLFDHDPFEMMTRLLGEDDPITAIDVGANVGWTAIRIADLFRNATVHAFEPMPEVYAEMAERVSKREQIRPHRLAVSDKEGSCVFHITNNRWCSSLLKPNDFGRRAYGDYYESDGETEVQTITIDAWAEQSRIDRIDLLKIDVQGAELSALRGTQRLLKRGITGIICEAQLIPEYEGAATFSQIDSFLTEAGYRIHQIHEVACAGDELQTSYVNGLWLHEPARQRLISNPIKRLPALPLERTAAALESLAGNGLEKAAIYGAGAHTVRIAPCFKEASVQVEAIIDDNPERHGSVISGVPVMGREEAIELGIEGVVLSSDAHEDAMWNATEDLRASGIRVVRLYGAAGAGGGV
ncbi:MAG: FkbM family methyltransferase [Planctomycetota bacterium]